MNRVLNVSLIIGLVCTLACAPGSRNQHPPAGANKGAIPGATPGTTPAPSPSGTPQLLSTIPVTVPGFAQNTKFDPSTAKLISADIVAPSTNEKPGSLMLAFKLLDSNKQLQNVGIILDGSTNVKSTDSANTSDITYVCSNSTTPGVMPDNCPRVDVNFTWNKMPATAIITTAQILNVVKAIDGKADPKVFGGAIVQKLDFTLGSQPFSVTHAEIVASGKDESGAVDDMQTDNSNHSIRVIGLLPLVDLENKAIRPAETLGNVKVGRNNSVFSMTANNGSQLIYSLTVKPDKDSIPVRTLTLTISLSNDVAQGATSTADQSKIPGAKVATPATGVATVPAANINDAAPSSLPEASAAAAALKVKSAAVPSTASKVITKAATAAPTVLPPPTFSNEDLSRRGMLALSPVQVTPPVEINQKDFCDFEANVKDAFIKARIDIVANKAAVVLDKKMLEGSNPWKSDFCDSVTGRIAARSDAPGAKACASRWINNNRSDDHNETVMFNVPNLTDPTSCKAHVTLYTTGRMDIDGPGCFVRPIDNLALHAWGDKDAAWSMASRTVHDAPKMTPIPTNSSQLRYQIHDNHDQYWDLFYDATLTDLNEKCWGRATAEVVPSKKLSFNN